MRLLFVVHQYFPECRSGTEQYCRAIAREATRRGDEVTVLSLEPWGVPDVPALQVVDEPYEGLPTPRLRHWERLSPHDVAKDAWNPIVARRFAALLDEVRPDAVHVFHLRQLGAGFLRVLHDRGIRTVVNLMDFWFLCPRFTLRRPDGVLCEGPPDGGLGCVPCEFPDLAPLVEDATVGTLLRSAATALASGPPLRPGDTARLAGVLRRKDDLLGLLGLADAVIAPSRFLADMFAKNGFSHPGLTVVPYGLDPGRVTRIPVERPRSPLRVAFAGVLSPWKAPDVAIRAVRQLDPERDGPIELTIHGDTGMAMFADYIAELRALAGDDPRIRFPGAYDHGELDQVFAATDLLVVPSTWYENTPFVVLEAFEAGVPVAVSDLGGMTEVVEDGVHGFRFPAGDADALAALLRALLAAPSRLAKLEPRPVATAADNYDVFRAIYAGVDATPASASTSAGTTTSAR